jgi:hypothetical protein
MEGDLLAENKKQHYVPKTYLKHFSNGKVFSVLNVDNDMIYEDVSYASQCYENYFYGNNLVWEKRLNSMEKQWGMVLDKICRGENIDDNDKTLLKQFSIYQYNRTVAREQFNITSYIENLRETAKVILQRNEISDEDFGDFLEQKAKEITSPEKSLEMVESLEELINDLEVIVIDCISETKLISSDAPVICINPFEPHGVGFGCMGLLIFFPVSDTKLVVIYDVKMYKSNSNISVISDKQEIHNLNAYQYISAERIIYGKSKGDLEFVSDDLKDERTKNKAIKPVHSLGSLDAKMIVMSNERIMYRGDLSFAHLSHDIRKIPLTCREAVPRKWEQGWQDKLKHKESIMPQLINLRAINKDEIGMTAKEIKRGCRLMSNYAEKYWKTNIEK